MDSCGAATLETLAVRCVSDNARRWGLDNLQFLPQSCLQKLANCLSAEDLLIFEELLIKKDVDVHSAWEWHAKHIKSSFCLRSFSIFPEIEQNISGKQIYMEAVFHELLCYTSFYPEHDNPLFYYKTPAHRLRVQQESTQCPPLGFSLEVFKPFIYHIKRLSIFGPQITALALTHPEFLDACKHNITTLKLRFLRPTNFSNALIIVRKLLREGQLKHLLIYNSFVEDPDMHKMLMLASGVEFRQSQTTESSSPDDINESSLDDDDGLLEDFGLERFPSVSAHPLSLEDAIATGALDTTDREAVMCVCATPLSSGASSSSSRCELGCRCVTPSDAAIESFGLMSVINDKRWTALTKFLPHWSSLRRIALIHSTFESSRLFTVLSVAAVDANLSSIDIQDCGAFQCDVGSFLRSLLIRQPRAVPALQVARLVGSHCCDTLTPAVDDFGHGRHVVCLDLSFCTFKESVINLLVGWLSSGVSIKDLSLASSLFPTDCLVQVLSALAQLNDCLNTLKINDLHVSEGSATSMLSEVLRKHTHLTELSMKGCYLNISLPATNQFLQVLAEHATLCDWSWAVNKLLAADTLSAVREIYNFNPTKRFTRLDLESNSLEESDCDTLLHILLQYPAAIIDKLMLSGNRLFNTPTTLQLRDRLKSRLQCVDLELIEQLPQLQAEHVAQM